MKFKVYLNSFIVHSAISKYIHNKGLHHTFSALFFRPGVGVLHRCQPLTKGPSSFPGTPCRDPAASLQLQLPTFYFAL